MSEIQQALMQGLARAATSGGDGMGGTPLSAAVPEAEGQSPDRASDDLRRALMAQLTAREEPEELKFGPRLGLALATAANTYAAGLNPRMKPTDHLARVRALRERRAQRRTADKQGAAKVGLEELNRSEALARDDARRVEDLDRRAAERGEDREFTETQTRLGLEAQEERDLLRDEQHRDSLAQQEDLFQRRLDAQAEQAREDRNQRIKELGKQHEARMAEIEERFGAQEARAVEQEHDKADRGAISLRNIFLEGDPDFPGHSVAEQLEAGKTPEQILRTFDRRVEALSARPATVQRMRDEIEDELRELSPGWDADPNAATAPRPELDPAGFSSLGLATPGFGVGDVQTQGAMHDKSLGEILESINRVDILRRGRP